MHVGETFCDLAKAFDCVNLEILLTILHFCCIKGSAANLFRLYLTDRRQKIETQSSNNTQNFFSNWGKIIHGIPQGSVLWPLPFIICIYIYIYIYI
jgi:hypothetical protein